MFLFPSNPPSPSALLLESSQHSPWGRAFRCLSGLADRLLASIMVGFLFLSVTNDATGSEVTGKVVANLPGQSALELELPSGETVGPVTVSPGDSLLDYEGRKIRGEWVENADGPHLKNIWPVEEVQERAMAGVNRTLLRKAAGMGRGRALGEGDYLPDFALFDQSAHPVFSRSLRRQSTVISFVFTRCRVAEMCPATTRRMAELQNRFAERGWEEPRVVLVSLDPVYDTPGILRQYADAYGLEADRAHLLTGSEEVVHALLRVFGIRVMQEDGTIDHSLATLVTDPYGRIVLRQEGSRWSADAVIDAMKPMMGEEEV